MLGGSEERRGLRLGLESWGWRGRVVSAKPRAWLGHTGSSAGMQICAKVIDTLETLSIA